MKKLVSVVLALTMVVSMLATASAATIGEMITSADDPFLELTLPVSVLGRRSGTGDYGTSLSILDGLNESVAVDYKATLDMAQVRGLFDKNFVTAALADPNAKAEFEAGTVSTEVKVTVEYPGATVANASTAGSITSGNQIFEEKGARAVSENKVEITYKNQDGITVDDLLQNTNKYLADVVFELSGENAAKYGTEGTNNVNVTIEGRSEITFTSKTVAVEYKGSGSFVITTTKVTSGGGSSTYIVRFNANGGTAIEAVRVRKGAKVDLPTPQRDGYVFAGWFTDSALTKKFDSESAVNSNLVLYAKWISVGECDGISGCPHNDFDDISSSMWYHRGIDFVLNKGLMIGIADRQFAPDMNVTRAMLVTVLWRNEGRPSSEKSAFDDLEKDSYYEGAVDWAVKNGIVTGHSEKVFAPNDAITREQFAAIMHRYAVYKKYDVSVGENTNILSYTDYSDIAEYAIGAMQYAAGSGLMTGRTESTLNSKDNATRAEMATILQRFMTENN